MNCDQGLENMHYKLARYGNIYSMLLYTLEYDMHLYMQIITLLFMMIYNMYMSLYSIYMYGNTDVNIIHTIKALYITDNFINILNK